MKRLAPLLMLAILSFSTQACSQYRNTEHTGFFGLKTIKASSNYVTKELKVENLTSLSLTGSPDIVYTQKAGKPKVEIYTSDNIVDLLDIYVKNHTLYVGFKKGTRVSYNKLKIRVSAEKLNSIAVAGSGDIELANGLKTENLNISIAGSGDIEGSHISCTDLQISIAGSGDIEGNDITCEKLKATVAGSGDLKLTDVKASHTTASVAGSGTVVLSGSTEEASYNVTGSGDLFASALKALKVSASVTGSGDIKCHATDYLKTRTSGSGSIGYKGNPELDQTKKGVYKL